MENLSVFSKENLIILRINKIKVISLRCFQRKLIKLAENGTLFKRVIVILNTLDAILLARRNLDGIQRR